MPNYTLEYSEEITQVRPEERRWLEEHLAHLESAADPLCEWSFEEEQSPASTNFWFHSDEQLPDPLLELLQAFFAHFRPDQYLIIRYALTCSRPLVGEKSVSIVMAAQAGRGLKRYRKFPQRLQRRKEDTGCRTGSKDTGCGRFELYNSTTLFFIEFIRCGMPLSRYRFGAFGGGKVLITADRVVWSDLEEWERQQIEQFQQCWR